MITVFNPSGCAAAIPLYTAYHGADMVASATGAGTADEKKIIRNTAVVLGLDESNIKISNIKKDDHVLTGSEIFYDAEIIDTEIIDSKTKKTAKILRCSMASSWMLDSKPGCIPKGGSATACNDLPRAAGKCN